MAAKTWKLTVNEEELRVLINHSASTIYNEPNPEKSLRLHDLVKRLSKKDEAEIEEQPQTAIEAPDPQGLGQAAAPVNAWGNANG
jgi:hypothetical protein